MVIKKIIAICLIFSTMAFCFTACANNTTNESNPPANEPYETVPIETTITETNEDDKTLDKVVENLTPSDIDFYGEINEDSPYIAAVVHNGNIEESDDGISDKTYITVYDIGQALNETQSLTDDWANAISNRHYLYNFCIAGKNGVFTCITNVREWKNGVVQFNTTDNANAEIIPIGQHEWSKTRFYEKSFERDSYLKSENWLADIYEDIIYSAHIKVGETEHENAYIQAFFKEPIVKNDNLQSEIQKALDNNEIKHSIIILNNSDEITDINRTIGKEYDLTQVSFLQDIIAYKISNAYGLNLKNKNVEIRSDIDYLRYSGYNENDEHIVSFEPIENYEDNMYLLEDMFDNYPNNFEYTDSDSNTYNYFVNGEQFYIYKNGQKIGAGRANTDDAFIALSGLFGIRA